MSVEEQALQPETAPAPRRLRPPSKDTVAVVAVIIASVAMVAALVAVGFAAHAVNVSNKRVSKTTVAAPAAPAAPATSAAPTAGTVVGAAVPAGSAAAAGPTSLAVAEHDFQISPAVTSLPAGLVDLHVTDNGPTGHELLIFQTDLAPDKFPIGADGRVDETGAGIQKVFDSGANIDVGTTKTFHTAFTAGNYVMICNLPGHYKAGMHTAFTVTPSAAPVTAVGVTQSDFSLTPAQTSFPAGLVDFNVTDNGPTPHELLIFQTDLAPDKLPLGPDGRVNEGGDGILKVFDSGDNVTVGTSKLFHAALAAGNYVMVCNLPGHYKAGMHTAFTVTGTPEVGTVVPATAPAAPAGPTSLAIAEHDFQISPAVTSLPAGLVDLHVTDNGPTAHELLIFQTDLAPDKLPIGSDGRVDERGAGVQKVFDSGANIDVGTTKTFHAALAAGNYVMICNLPGHYKAGMHTAFTVTPSAAPVTAVGVTQADFSLTPAQTSFPAGLVDLNVTDNGPTAHELLIFQTDLAPDKLPIGSDGRVDEGGDGILKVFDSGDNVTVGTSKLFHTALAAGNYVMVCNLPGHYKAGMHTAFTVTGTPEVGTVVPATATTS